MRSAPSVAGITTTVYVNRVMVMSEWYDWFNGLSEEMQSFWIWQLWENHNKPLSNIQKDILQGIKDMGKEGLMPSINTLAKYTHHDKNTVGKDVELLEMRGIVYTTKENKTKYVMLRLKDGNI